MSKKRGSSPSFTEVVVNGRILFALLTSDGGQKVAERMIWRSLLRTRSIPLSAKQFKTDSKTLREMVRRFPSSAQGIALYGNGRRLKQGASKKGGGR